jgi:hypothetical protein
MVPRQVSMVVAVAFAAMSLSAVGRAGQDPPSAAAAPPASVATGTRFLVGLQDKLSTRKDKPGKRFKARTLEPLETADGNLLPPGAEVRGHISRIEPGGLTGRARLWLSFDDIKTRGGREPLVADVAGVPGEHSVKPGDSQQGEIEARTSKGTRELEAAAAGAAIGAAVGAATKGGKGAAIGAAIGGAGGFLVASGVGQELELQKGTKLELQLSRPLYLARK